MTGDCGRVRLGCLWSNTGISRIIANFRKAGKDEARKRRFDHAHTVQMPFKRLHLNECSACPTFAQPLLKDKSRSPFLMQQEVYRALAQPCPGHAFNVIATLEEKTSVVPGSCRYAEQ